MAIEKGQILEGTVTNITGFGAFVNLGDKTGMVHISEISGTYIENIGDVLKPGDKVKVKVLSSEENGKISLSIKQAQARTEDTSRTEKPSYPRPQREVRERNLRGGSVSSGQKGPQSFEDMMSKFQKESEEKNAEVRRRTEGGGNKKRRG